MITNLKNICQLVLFLVLSLEQCLSETTDNLDFKVNTRKIGDIPKEIAALVNPDEWPHDYFFDNPLIKKLTGHEEPLKRIQIMPYRVKDIQTRFSLYSSWSPKKNKHLFDLSYNNQTSLDAFPSKRCSKLIVIIHGWGVSSKDANYELLKHSILNNEENTCVIGVDWSTLR